MSINPRLIFARDLKPGMTVTQWREVEPPSQRRILQIELVGIPTWEYVSARTEVTLAGWALDDAGVRVLRVADRFAADFVFALADKDDPDV